MGGRAVQRQVSGEHDGVNVAAGAAAAASGDGRRLQAEYAVWGSDEHGSPSRPDGQSVGVYAIDKQACSDSVKLQAIRDLLSVLAVSDAVVVSIAASGDVLPPPLQAVQHLTKLAHRVL